MKIRSFPIWIEKGSSTNQIRMNLLFANVLILILISSFLPGCFCEKPTNNKMDNLYKLYLPLSLSTPFLDISAKKQVPFSVIDVAPKVPGLILNLAWETFNVHFSPCVYFSLENVIQNTSTHSTPSAPAPSVIDSSIYKGYVEDLLLHHKYPQVLIFLFFLCLDFKPFAGHLSSRTMPDHQHSTQILCRCKNEHLCR